MTPLLHCIQGTSALHRAIGNGSDEFVLMLIQMGADIEDRNFDGPVKTKCQFIDPVMCSKNTDGGCSVTEGRSISSVSSLGKAAVLPSFYTDVFANTILMVLLAFKG